MPPRHHPIAALAASALLVSHPLYAQTGSPRYDLEVSIPPEAGRVEVGGTLHVPRSLATGGRLVLLHSAEAAGVSLDGPDVDSVSAGSAEGITRWTLQLGADLSDTLRLDVSYRLTIPSDHALNRITPDWIELNIDSFWHPVVASIPDIRYRLRLDVGGDLELISGDDVTALDNGIYAVANYIARRDIPFSAGPDLRSARGVLSEAWSPMADVDLEGVVRASDSILVFLRDYTGRAEDFERPRRIALTPREESGYSRKNYVAMSDVRDMDSLDLSGYLAHEFSHYWFSNAQFQSRHHWLTESFAEYLSMLYMRTRFGDEWFQNELAEKRTRVEVDPTPMAEFEGRPPHVALYHRGPLVLYEFEADIGADAFRSLIRAFIREDIRTTGGLLALIEEDLGAGARRTLERLLAEV